jgi:hypothetical protein
MVSPPVLGRVLAAAALLLALMPVAASAAPGLDDPADQWLPRADGAEWVYAWSNSDFSTTPRTERYRIQARTGTSFRLAWSEVGTPPAGSTASSGTMDFQHTDAGLVNLNYQSTPPPPGFPILCASASECGNSLAGSLYLVIWGTRSPVLSEPLLRGTRWNSLGGAGNDVASSNRYAGREKVVVPAFPAGVEAAKVESELTQAGAIGDPFGSGIRTVYWVRGVGPVRITFRHAGGQLSTAELQSTTLQPRPLPSEVNLLPLNRGDRATFRWRNSKHMRTWSRQQVDVAEVVNGSARVDVKNLSGPIAVAASYTFSSRLSGITNLAGVARAQTRAHFPQLGPRAAPSADRRRFLTPVDLMVYGFNPVLPAYPRKGDTWRSSREGRDWRVYGVTGISKVIGTRTVRTPAGKYRATGVRSTLRQPGYRFGSGTRTSWFAPGEGLVKLVFRHRDGSVSTVERQR